MVLSCSAPELVKLTKEELIAAIIERRIKIRYCRDQRGDDRCFLDYYLIWQFLSDSPPMPRFSPEEGMKRCEAFYENCRSEAADSILENDFCEWLDWDANLHRLSHSELFRKLLRLQVAIADHRDVEVEQNRPRNLEDDRRLFWAALPEREPADFRLPAREEFLESQGNRSGCPAFWKSHAGCNGTCDLHDWGPCRE